jgi:hypothetical protein
VSTRKGEREGARIRKQKGSIHCCKCCPHICLVRWLVDFCRTARILELLDDFGYNAGANGSSAFTDSKSESLLDGDGGDQVDFHDDVVARHTHFNAIRKLQVAGYVGGSEIELRSVTVEERGMSSAFFLLQDVYLAFELGVGIDGARLCKNLSSFDFRSLHASKK